MRELVELAVIPGMLIMWYVYKKDGIEKEPTKLLVKLFIMGALSIVPAIILEYLGEYILYGTIDEEVQATWVELFIDNFFVIALAEEYCKYRMLKWGSWKNKAFDYRFDAIVYAVVTGMGFAVLENIFYVVENGFANGIIRALVSVPGHAAFAICMGIYYGEAKYCEAREDKRGKKKNLRLAVFMPLLMHGFFDFCLSTDSDLLLVVFFVYIICVDIVCFKKIKKYSSEDARLQAYASDDSFEREDDGFTV